ncbi:MAG: STAS domain-containing protein [Deltaproteobacteria bacterium]|nr:STAS domain-containing protein [Deltaproteobacteria bacterium]
MEVTETRLEGILVLGVKGRLDSTNSEDFERMLLGSVRQGENRLVLDFGELDYISSAGLRVLLKAVKELKVSDGHLALCSVRDYIKEIFEMSGFVSFLPIHSTVEDSLRAV